MHPDKGDSPKRHPENVRTPKPGRQPLRRDVDPEALRTVDPYDERHPINTALSLLNMVRANIDNQNYGQAKDITHAAYIELCRLVKRP